MSKLAELQMELQEASAAIVRAERTVAQHPDIPSAAATLRTIIKRRDNLEQQFFAEANEVGLDVCGYRIEPNEGRATIAAVTAVLGAFQKTFTNVYDALTLGRPKMKAKASRDTIEATAFEFAYSFPGSIGIMMTLPNDRLLLGETGLDDAIKTTFDLLNAKTQDEVQLITDKVGLPAVRAAHEWAEENAKAGFGARITWQRDEVIRDSMHAQTQELAQLSSFMKQIHAREEITVIGELVEVDLIVRKFQMRVGEKIIRGDFKDAIGTAHPAQLPKLYKATLQVQQKIVPESDQEEEIVYFLLRLEEPDRLATFLPAS